MSDQIAVDCDAADMERATELAAIAMTSGTDSDEFHAKLRLIVAEYEYPQMMLALYNVLAGAPSTITHEATEVVDQITTVSARYSKRWPAKGAAEVLASIEEGTDG